MVFTLWSCPDIITWFLTRSFPPGGPGCGERCSLAVLGGPGSGGGTACGGMAAPSPLVPWRGGRARSCLPLLVCRAQTPTAGEGGHLQRPHALHIWSHQGGGHQEALRAVNGVGVSELVPCVNTFMRPRGRAVCPRWISQIGTCSFFYRRRPRAPSLIYECG